MRKIRMARKNVGGEQFIECPANLWDAIFERRDREGTSAIPMPMGHRMFTHPIEYGVDIYMIDQEEIDLGGGWQ
jgi:hypothetical protein